MRLYDRCSLTVIIETLLAHSMARVNLNKGANFVTYTTTASKYMPESASIKIPLSDLILLLKTFSQCAHL